MPERSTPQNPGYEALSDALSVSFRVLRWVMVLLLAAYLLSGIFIVGQNENAFVLVFGKIAGLGADRVKGPGLHWTFPRPIAEVVRIPVARVQSVETTTFWHKEAPKPPTMPGGPPPPLPVGPSIRPGEEGYTLTGDANLLHSKWAVRYTIDDPEAYAFHFRYNGPADDRVGEDVIARELDHAIVMATARFTIDQALRTDIEAVREAVASELQKRMEALGVGVKIEGVDLLDVSPPLQVIDAFNQVVAAENERSEKISAARGYAARTLNEAQGQAAKLIAEGQTYAQRVVSEVSADADYFNKVCEQYVKDPDVIGRTLLQDTLRRTLANVEKDLVSPDSKGQFELRLQISREQKKIGETK